MIQATPEQISIFKQAAAQRYAERGVPPAVAEQLFERQMYKLAVEMGLAPAVKQAKCGGKKKPMRKPVKKAAEAPEIAAVKERWSRIKSSPTVAAIKASPEAAAVKERWARLNKKRPPAPAKSAPAAPKGKPTKPERYAAKKPAAPATEKTSAVELTEITEKLADVIASSIGRQRKR